MPLRVLTKHGVVTHDGPLVSLAVPELSYVQRAKLKRAANSGSRSSLKSGTSRFGLPPARNGPGAR